MTIVETDLNSKIQKMNRISQEKRIEYTNAQQIATGLSSILLQGRNKVTPGIPTVMEKDGKTVKTPAVRERNETVYDEQPKDSVTKESMSDERRQHIFDDLSKKADAY